MRSLRSKLIVALVVPFPTAFALSPTTIPSAESWANDINLGFSIGDLELSPQLKFVGVSASCAALEFTADGITCTRARLAAKNSPFGPVSMAAHLQWDANGRWRIEANGKYGDEGTLKLSLQSLRGALHMVLDAREFAAPDLPIVLGSLPTMLIDHSIDSGVVNLKTTCDFAADGDSSCRYEGDATGLNIDGVNVAEDLNLSFDVTYQARMGTADLNSQIELRDGAIYFEPGFKLGAVNPGFFIAIDGEPIELSAEIAWLEDEKMHVRGASIVHPQIVEMQFKGDLNFSAGPQWRDLHFRLKASDVKSFYTSYMQPIALDTAFASLETAGAVEVQIDGAANEIDRLSLHFEQVFIDDEARRFSLYGLNGDIELHAGEVPVASTVEWIGGALYKVPIGAGRIDWLSAQRGLKVAGWQDLALFDGVFRLDSLEVLDFGLDKTKIALSGTLTPITLSAFTAAFGWMPLSGKLSGEIPRLTYSGNRLNIDGDLTFKVFDGAIAIRALKIDKMFSTVPVLSANIAIESLDLESLTRTFSFGNISGHLDGRIDDLVLQAWQPIQFDASFFTPIDDEAPHRISQQAVDNLGRLGAGTGSALSQGWLGLIPSYSYGRLGIACQLQDGHCLMDGVESSSDGAFYILTRGGILPPWIDVKGTGRRIKWKTLVDGIKQISQGDFELDIGAGSSSAKKTH